VWQQWKSLLDQNCKFCLCILSIQSTNGLHKNSSEGPLFKALTSVWLKELRSLAG
ncbi:unnamed protein product, partial [Bubo scandiacus]